MSLHGILTLQFDKKGKIESITFLMEADNSNAKMKSISDKITLLLFYIALPNLPDHFINKLKGRLFNYLWNSKTNRRRSENRKH